MQCTTMIEPEISATGKGSIGSILQKHDVNMKVQLEQSAVLLGQVQNMTEQTENLYSTITAQIRPELADSTGQLQLLTADLADTSQLLQLISQLVHMQEQLARVEQLQHDQQLTAAADTLVELRSKLDTLWQETAKMVPSVDALRERVLLQRESLLQHCSRQLAACLLWQADQLTVADAAAAADSCAALQRLDRLQRPMQLFSESLQNHLVTPLAHGRRLRVDRATENHVTLSVSAADEAAAQSDPGALIDNLYTDVSTLLTLLWRSVLPGALMAQLGRHAAAALAECIVAGPLADAVPASLEDRVQFDAVIASTTNFSRKLTEIGFWPDGGTLLERVQDADRLIVDRICADRLQRARQLAVAALHDTVAVGDSISQQAEASHTAPPGDKDHAVESGTPLQDGILRLPHCHVSASAVALAELVRAAQLEAERSAPLLAARLHYTARHSVELYLALLPSCHQTALAQLPEAPAVAHNNLQYLAHGLTWTATTHRFRLGTLLDLVPELRAQAADLMRAALERHRQHLLDILDDAGLDRLSTSSDGAAADGALRQCLYQLRHVCRVWRRVLPAGVQARAAGTLLAAVSSEVTRRVLAQQDISASAGAHLCTAARHLTHGAHTLFMTEQEVTSSDSPSTSAEADPGGAAAESEARGLLARHTPGWHRFCELIIVLEANMKGVLDRWSDGKGALAQQFSAEEVRHLVRALFQNNERRAATLARIR